MSISVRCSDCNTSYRLADEQAGRRFRCRKCGAVVRVPSEYDDDLIANERPIRRDVRSQRAKAKKSELPWMLIGGITAGVGALFLLMLLFRAGGGSRQVEWVADPTAIAALDREVNLGGHAIRPPRGYQLMRQESANGVKTSVKYIWNGNASDQLTVEFNIDPRYHPDFEPLVITRPGSYMQFGSTDTYSFPGATHDRSTIHGQRFQRIFQGKEPNNPNGSAHCFYMAYFQAARVEIQIVSHQGENSAVFKVLEAAALSFRVGPPSDPQATPVQQLLAANPQNSTRKSGKANPSGVPPVLVAANANPIKPSTPNPTLPNASNNATDTATPQAVKKSRGVPKLSNAPSGQSLLNYAYQPPQVPGVLHIYPNESYQPAIAIPATSSSFVVNQPVTSSEFLLVESNVWNLKTGEQSGHVDLKINDAETVALSPDGKLVAHRERGKDEDPICIYSMESGRKTVEIDARKGQARLEWLGFLSPTRLMIVWSQWNGTRDNAVQFWDATTGDGLSAFGLGHFGRDAMSVSTDGERMLFRTSDGVGYVELSHKSPKPVSLPSPDRSSLGPISGLAFSPDNSRAAIYRGNGAGMSILEWDVSRKKIVQNGTIPLNVNDIGFIGLRDRGAFRWTPDSDYWLVKGHLLIDCKTGNPVWLLQSLFAVYAMPIMHDRETMLVPVQSKGSQTYLVSVPFPWDKIRAATEAMNDHSTPALLRPGASVSMEFSPGPLRFMPADQMAQVLGEPLAERLKSFGIKVEANQSTVLYIKYQEQTGENLQVVERRSPFDLHGTPTGQSVNETHYELEVGWKQLGSEQPIWKTTSRGSTSRSSSSPTVSDQSLHKEMVDRLKRQLNSQMIPYFIPEDQNIPLLPVISTR